ncbi:alpha-1,6-mannosyltransferase [Ascosphaera acerosa]|nr:alpha-1,6-mannosyltransferase [Ascosphaera acerosa]
MSVASASTSRSASRAPSPPPAYYGGAGSGSLSPGLPGSASPAFRSGGTTPVNSAILSNGGLASPGLGSPGLLPSNSGSNLVAAAGTTGPVSWESAKAKSDAVRGYPSFSTRNHGFFSRQRRKISASLPRFGGGGGGGASDEAGGMAGSGASFGAYAAGEKERFLGFGLPAWGSMSGTPAEKIRWLSYSLWRKKRVRFFIIALAAFLIWVFMGAAIRHLYQRSALGHGKKIVLIVASNVGGGVMELKGAREWAIERESLKNKRRYVEKWGYDLEIVNMMTKKRYAHEWRESWEKVDVIRSAMRKYPHAEW